MSRLEVGIDGNCIYVGLGNMPDGDFVFEEYDTKKPIREQAREVVNTWYKKFPLHGLLPFDYLDGI